MIDLTPRSNREFLEEVIRMGRESEKNPRFANKTAEENETIIKINIYWAMEDAMKKMNEAGKKAMIDARDWAIFEGYKSLTFVAPVPEREVVAAAKEIFMAYSRAKEGEKK